MNGKRNILRTVKSKMACWIGHILRRSCFLNDIIEGKIEGRIGEMGRR